VSITEELLGRNSSGYGLERREYGRRGSVTLTTLHPISAKVGNSGHGGFFLPRTSFSFILKIEANGGIAAPFLASGE
jgi:hypothetical protein